MDPSKNQILEAQIKAVRDLTGKSRLDALKIIQNQMQFKEYVEELIVKEEQRIQSFRGFLDNQTAELMHRYGMTRLEALKIVQKVLDEKKPVMQVMKEMQCNRPDSITPVPPKYSDKDLLIMLLENLRDDFYSNKDGRLFDIAMFLHQDECEPHSPYVPRNTLNISDMNILEKEYKLTQDELRYYKLIDFE